MKTIIQRVSSASVTVNGTVTGSINKGYVILLGIGNSDSRTDVERLVDKIQKLRIFNDENGKINLSINEVGGGILVISQFTLYADCKKNRPGFTDAAPPALAEELYNYFIEYARSGNKFAAVESGSFGAMMNVELINEGPFTIILES